MSCVFFLNWKWLSTDGFILDQFPLGQVAKYRQEGILYGLTQTESMILVSLITVTFYDAITIIIHHVLNKHQYLLILQVPIKHKKRTDDVFLPNMAENVQLTAFQVQTAPSRFPFRADW